MAGVEIDQEPMATHTRAGGSTRTPRTTKQSLSPISSTLKTGPRSARQSPSQLNSVAREDGKTFSDRGTPTQTSPLPLSQLPRGRPSGLPCRPILWRAIPERDQTPGPRRTETAPYAWRGSRASKTRTLWNVDTPSMCHVSRGRIEPPAQLADVKLASQCSRESGP